LCPTSKSCCSDEVLDQLSNITRQEYENKVEQLSNNMKAMFNKKFKKFDGKLMIFFKKNITEISIILVIT